MNKEKKNLKEVKSKNKKDVVSKEKSIKDKVNELTSDLDLLTKPIKVESIIDETKPVTKVDDNSVKWLEEEIDRLVAENKKFEQELMKHSLKVNNPNSNIVDNDIQNKIIKIYKELYNNLNGLNESGVSWKDVKIEYLLNKFRVEFPFIR